MKIGDSITLFIPADGSGAIVGVVGALQLDVLLDRLEAEYGLEASFEQTRFTLCRWINGKTPADLDKFARSHGSSMAEDFDGAPVFMAPSAWDINYEAERWPDVAFADIKDYQKDTFGTP